MSGYDFSQEYANALLEEADRTIEGLEARLRMSDSALTEATESIVQMREQIATLTRQRDLAVYGLNEAEVYMTYCKPIEAMREIRKALSAIKESEAK